MEKFITAIAIAVLVWRIFVFLGKLITFHAFAISKEKATVSYGWDWLIIFISSLIIALYFLY